MVSSITFRQAFLRGQKAETRPGVLPDDKEVPFFAARKDPTATDASHIHRDPPDAAATAQAKARPVCKVILGRFMVPPC